MNMVSTQTSKNLLKRDVPVNRMENDADLREFYELGRKVGQGSFGIVYEATHIETQTKWAIKVVCRLAAPGSSKTKMLWDEINILKKVNHPHIIQVQAIYYTTVNIYLVTELCRGGDLKQLLQRKTIFTEDETRNIMCSLTDAVVYLHKRDIVHRDLKLENILVRDSLDEDDGKINIKVTDFGLSVKTVGVGIETRMREACGTLIYMAPEVMSDRGYSQWCDVWSIGVVMHMLLCGKPPFFAKSKSALLEEIRKTPLKFTEPIWETVSDAAKHVLICLLKVDPAYRMSASQLLEHPWITGNTDVPAVQSNVLEMMQHHLEQEEREQSLEVLSPTSSEDILDPSPVPQAVSTETNSYCSSHAKHSPKNNHSTSTCSTSTKQSGGKKTQVKGYGLLQDTSQSSSDTLPHAGMKAPPPSSAKPRKPQDRSDPGTGQKPACSPSKADDHRPSTSSKVDVSPTNSQYSQKPLLAQIKSKK